MERTKSAPTVTARDLHTIVGTPDGQPEVEAGAVDREGEAAADEAASRVVVRLFERDRPPRDVPVADVTALASDDERFVWVDFGEYRADDLRAIARELDLPEAAVRVALAGWQRPRLAVYGSCYFVAVTVPRREGEGRRVLAGELDLFVGRNVLVSAHKTPLPFAEEAEARAAQNPPLLLLDSAFLLSILLDELIAYYEQLTEGLEGEIETMEERALTDVSDAFLDDLLHLKRYVFAVYRLARQHQAVFDAFLRPDFPLVGGEEVEPYFRDLDERLARLLDGLEAAREAVNGAFDIYVSRVSHRTNEIMRVLTIVSTLLLPSTVILGFFGTNFDSPHISTFAGFVAMVASMVMVTVGILIVFVRWGWIRRPLRAPADGDTDRADSSEAPPRPTLTQDAGNTPSAQKTAP